MNTVLPEFALCLFAYARDVDEGLVQHGLSLRAIQRACLKNP
jgi:hypothetical protein